MLKIDFDDKDIYVKYNDGEKRDCVCGRACIGK